MCQHFYGSSASSVRAGGDCLRNKGLRGLGGGGGGSMRLEGGALAAVYFMLINVPVRLKSNEKKCMFFMRK